VGNNVDTKAFAAKQIALTTASQEILGPSSNRYGILLAPPPWGTAYLAAGVPAVVNQGFPLHRGLPYLWLCRDVHGDLVSRPWYGLFNATELAVDQCGVGSILYATITPAKGANLSLGVAVAAGYYQALQGYAIGFTDIAAQTTLSIVVSGNAWELAGFWSQVVRDYTRPLIAPVSTVIYLNGVGVAGSTLCGSIRGVVLPPPTMTIVEVICPCSYEEVRRAIPQFGPAY